MTWTKDKIIRIIKRMDTRGEYLGGGTVRSEFPSLYDMARNLFGSWRVAIEASGLDYSEKATRVWTRDRILREIGDLHRAGQKLNSGVIGKTRSGLYNASIREFGSWKDAIDRAGLDWDSISKVESWSKERILAEIRRLADQGMPLNYKFAYYQHTRLLKAAEKHMGSWKAALEAAGFDYDAVRRDRGKPEFRGRDGGCYDSTLEMLVADKLLVMKNNGTILDYDSHTGFLYNRKWSCDFLVYLRNNTELWMEVDGMGASRTMPYSDTHPKIAFYKESGLMFAVITAESQVETVIAKHTDPYVIPEKTTLITAHANPDADAVASCRAIYDHLTDAGKDAHILLKGEIPKNLAILLPEDAMTEGIPENVEQVIVLDSSPDSERIGWPIPENLPILNIDHHVGRIDEHDPARGVFVIDASSTASILVRWFGIRNDVLLAGLFGDTLFCRRIPEVGQIITSLGVRNAVAESLVRVVNNMESGIVLAAIQNAKVRRCRNGFMIVELKHGLPKWAITETASILGRMSESLCMIAVDGEVRLRTQNPNLNMESIASEFGGGGHDFAAVCHVNGRKSALTDIVVRMMVPPIDDETSKKKEKKE